MEETTAPDCGPTGGVEQSFEQSLVLGHYTTQDSMVSMTTHGQDLIPYEVRNGGQRSGRKGTMGGCSPPFTEGFVPIQALTLAAFY